MARQHSFFLRLYFDLAAEERPPRLIGRIGVGGFQMTGVVRARSTLEFKQEAARAWRRLIDNESLKIKKLEQVFVEKLCQLFRHLL